MNDFRKEMAPVSGDVVKAINDLATPKWAIPFLGRRLNSVCKAKFDDADTKGFRLELPWEGQVKYESHNAYDDSTYTHELVVAVYSEGPAAGRIKSVQSHHWEYWHTSSNWQDHSERHTYDRREPTEDEIKQYKELLEGWTEGGSAELVQSLSDALSLIVQEHDGEIRVAFCDHKEPSHPNYKAISISILREDSPIPVSIVINLDQLIEALDYSRIFIEAIHSKDDRGKLGICKDESWTLQYCLNLFDIFKAEQLYQNIDLALKAWLYKLYVSCSYYRDFLNIPSDAWWRDAWWRMQEVVEGKHRVSENQALVFNNCRPNFYNAKPYLEKDPLGSLVGKLRMPYDRAVKPFSIDNAISLSRPIKGGRERYKFSSAIVNGVNWSICIHGCDEVAIDLAASEVVDLLEDGVVVIPYQINGRAVTQIHMIDRAIDKGWRKIVFAAPITKDLESDCDKSLSKPFDDDDDDYDDGFEDDDYVRPKYEKWLTINEGAFRGWQSLEEVVFERKDNYLRSYAFDGCVNLKRVTFGGNRCSIGDRCFQSCTALAEIGTINGDVGAESFRECTSLKHLAMNCIAMGFGSGVHLGEAAFEGCTALETVHIEFANTNPDKKVKCSCLPRKIFFGCVAMQEIHLPLNIKILEEECLGGCSRDCVLHYEGDAFWFVGKGALPDLKRSYYWGKTIQYEKKDVVLSTLLDQLGVKREQYVDACVKYQDADYSIATLIGIIMGKKPLRRHNYVDHYDDYNDYSPRTFEDMYEIYGSRLWDA